ncbi:tyrosine-protein phosphatase non-receptor type 23-like isoform X2 [Artemia franciscana]|uniref:Tyrosine-protein phosphatase non-receptor type 23 n=2 Tax=Artemia franciscana TaxID=6661 RepID=A0AA88KY32_ARTSF|nr:hypothetical protein QYM36_014494 [Artemia franciscana]
MEDVPRLPFLSFELKKGNSECDLEFCLKKLVRDYFQDNPESFASEIREFEGCRYAAINCAKDTSGCVALKKYFCQLQMLLNRLPKDEKLLPSFNFTWTDVYAGITFTVSDVKYELAAVLYNIAALHSQLGQIEERFSFDGMKVVCSHFQCASWAFQKINKHFTQPRGTDMAPDLMELFEIVCLAQAQECILEKCVVDNRRPVNTAKIAAQVVDYYKASLHILEKAMKSQDEESLGEFIGSHLLKRWRKVFEFKNLYYNAIVYLFQGINAEEMQKMGDRISYYQGAMDKLKAAGEVHKGIQETEAFGEALAITSTFIGNKLHVSNKENEFIYHEAAPTLASLPEVRAASLAKGIGFDFTDPEIAGPDIFGRLISIEAHATSSLYSEEKAKLLRNVSERIESKDDKLNEVLDVLQVENLVLSFENQRLPEELIERCAAFSVKADAIGVMNRLMVELTDQTKKVEDTLSYCDELLKLDEEKEAAYHKAIGKRPPSMVLAEIRHEMEKYRNAHKKASVSNDLLHKASAAQIANLKILSQPLDEIEEQLPSLGRLRNTPHEMHMMEMNRLVKKVEEMKRQRIVFAHQLREALQADDLTKKLAALSSDNNPETLFKEEIQKHDQQVQLIEQNLYAQENILQALIETNARFADTRKAINDILAARDDTIKALIDAYDVYDDLRAKTESGIEFYKKLDENLDKLQKRLSSVCSVQEEEREETLKKRELKKFYGETDSMPGARLKDYLFARTSASSYPGFRPSPLGAENPSVKGYPLDSYASSSSSAALTYAFEKVSLGQEYHSTANKMPSQSPLNLPYPPGSEMPTMSPGSVATLDSRMKYSAAFSPPTQNQVLKYGAEMEPVKYSAPTSVPYQPYPSTMSHTAVGYLPHGSYYNSLPAGNLRTGNPSSESPFFSSSSNQPVHDKFVAQQSNLNQPYEQPKSAAGIYQGGFPDWRVASSHPQAATFTSIPSHSSVPVPSMYPNKEYQQQYNMNETRQIHQVTSPGSVTSYSRMPLSPMVVSIPSSTPYSVTFGQHQPTAQVPGLPQNTPASLNLSTNVTFSTSTVSISQPSTYQYSQVASNYPYSQCSTPSMQVTPLGWPGSSSGKQTSTIHTSGPLQDSLASSNSSADSSYSNTGVNNYQAYGYQSSYVAANYPYNSNSSVQAAPSSTGLPSSQFTSKEPVLSANVSCPSSGHTFPHYPQARGAFPSQNEHSIAGSSVNPLPVMQPNSYYPQASPIRQANTSTHFQVRPTFKKQELLNNVLDSVNSVPVSVAILQPTPVGSVTSSPVHTSRSSSVMSNVDLLAELDAALSITQATPQSEIKHQKVQSTQSETNKVASSTSAEDQILAERQETLLMDHKGDIFSETSVLERFTLDVDKFDRFVDGLTKRSINGPTPLELKWKELLDSQNQESVKSKISVARCYPMKNRQPDILPFDHNRILLPSTKDDYINASKLESLLKGGPSFIATQCPLNSTISDFWVMIWEQQVEVLVCLLTDIELSAFTYFPKGKEAPIDVGNFTVNLQTVKCKPLWTERVVQLTNRDTKVSRYVVHLQFTCWGSTDFPASTSGFLAFVSECIYFWKQQRHLSRPFVVHCLAGAGKTGTFIVVLTAILETGSTSNISDVARLATSISLSRRNILRDKDFLLFSYRCLLDYCLELLRKHAVHNTEPKSEIPIASSEKLTAIETLDVIGDEGKEAAKGALCKPTEESDSEVEAKALVSSSSMLPVDNSLKLIMDPNQFSLEAPQRRSNKQEMKDRFLCGESKLSSLDADPTDPFSFIDPLWSLKKDSKK